MWMLKADVFYGIGVLLLKPQTSLPALGEKNKVKALPSGLLAKRHVASRGGKAPVGLERE